MYRRKTKIPAALRREIKTEAEGKVNLKESKIGKAIKNKFVEMFTCGIC